MFEFYWTIIIIHAIKTEKASETLSDLSKSMRKASVCSKLCKTEQNFNWFLVQHDICS